MIVPGSPNALMLGGSQSYQISRSVRLRSSASAYFSRTPGVAGNSQKWTLSFWVKRGRLGVMQQILSAYSAGANKGTYAIFDASDRLVIYDYDAAGAGAYIWVLTSAAVFRDPSAWYHVVFSVDTTQATAANRVSMYVNNVLQTVTATYPSQNYSTYLNTTIAHYLGSYLASSSFLDGYITEMNLIDGQALTPSSFGQNDLTTGVWTPKAYKGTYGTNGFYLNFSDNSAATAAAIGKDYSGNSNNWTPTNISVTAGVTYDSMIDTPTPYADGGNGRGNYCTWNPISNSSASNSFTFSNANLQASLTSSSGGRAITATQEMRSGKWYAEFVVSSWGASNNADIGILRSDTTVMNTSSFALAGIVGSYLSNGYAIAQTGTVQSNGSSLATGLTTFNTTDIVQIAYDADNGKLYFGKNGTWLNSANPSAGTGGFSVTTGFGYLFAFGGTSGASQTETATANFGQSAFTYTPPTGFQALNTQNLPTPTIRKGNTWFDATPYTGTNAAGLNIVNSGAFQPDLVWIKSRSVASTNHALYDSARTLGYYLMSNQTNAEGIPSPNDAFLSFNSNGFSLGANNNAGSPNINFTNGGSYIAWQWKKGATPGFDIVTYTGTGAARTIAHGLGVAPSMIIVKRRSTTGNWPVYHASLGNATSPFLNLTNAANSQPNLWNSTTPTSSVFTVGTDAETNASGATLVAYLFAEVAGFSKFGSYVGNGSTDGTFVFCGFRPKLVLVKAAGTANGTANNTVWTIWDTSRNTYNATVQELYPNSSNAEATDSAGIDILSNGFKLKRNSEYANWSGTTYIFAAFAENPFKYSLAR